MQNIVMNMCVKFHNDWLRNEGALGDRSSDNNNPNKKKKKNVHETSFRVKTTVCVRVYGNGGNNHRRRGTCPSPPLPKKRKKIGKKYFSGTYYVKFGYLSGKNIVKIREFC